MAKLSWLRIPAELRSRRQWAVATLHPNPNNGGKPDKAPRNPRTGYLIDLTNPNNWCTFDEAINSGYAAIGYILSADDPFTIIDLDNKEQLTPEDRDRQTKIYEVFPSYAERSQSGSGCHIIVRGRIGGGRNRDGVEVYDQERFIICTGDVVRDAAVVDCQELVTRLVDEMGGVSQEIALPEDGPEVESDMALLERACRARNGEKFKDLFYNKPGPGDDWSARDAALAQLLAFYTRNVTQAMRLFRQSALYRPNDKGKNPEHYEAYYLRRTFARAYDHMKQHDADLEVGRRMAEQVINAHRVEVNGAHYPNAGGGVEASLTFPPGLVGDIATYILRAAPRPVPEIALAGAITLFAGIVGRQFNISRTGLNLYTVIVAKTGRGKEGASSGIDGLINACKEKMPVIETFRGPGHIASGQALIKQLDEKPAMFAVLSEFGHLMKILTDPRASASDMRTRQVLLDLFSKSGRHQSLQPSIYSDRDKNTKIVQAPAFSFLGDTTPERFYEAFSSTTVEEGLFPRFLTITYAGPRVPANRHPVASPDPDLVERMGSLLTSVANMQHSHAFHEVAIAPDAQQMMDAFDAECDQHINESHHDAGAELWNRAHLKVLRLAALLAVGRNHFEPVVTVEDAEWAKRLVVREMSEIAERLESGDVGKDEVRQLPAVTSAIKDYLAMSDQQRSNYKIPRPLHGTPYIPYTYFRRRFRLRTEFTSDRRGVTAAIKSALSDAVELGLLQEVSPEQKTQIGGLRVNGVLYVPGENLS